MKTVLEERDFIEHLIKGSDQAFQLLFEKYWTHVFGTVKKLVKSPEIAEDITQEIFVKVWNRRKDLSSINNIEAYLYTVSKNTTLDALRKKVLLTDNIEHLIHYFKDQALTPQQSLEYQELQQNIQQAIDILPEKVKEVFVLSRFEGLSHEEISEKLNISITSSKTYIVRALKLIRAHMANNTDLPLLAMAALLLEKIISHTK
ncbi:RNA polymerase sigma factor [Sphingobacterium faecale]|uniref:RNA polymerase sigma-70 factor n=1 Tax=Sphingobacterium faecale TaxID=2803775 RepID=A0ABS1QXL7_9SPHI|nr:RNA polymerase sigma-70 factor [Sphingobacterium faecale]MBL1407173.1 RNA polymerase sigma-70 factor [Sphingobacterium faecale]